MASSSDPGAGNLTVVSELAEPQPDPPLDPPNILGLFAAAARAQMRYEELGELGRGGMGRVYQARDRVLGRDVAIKVSLARDHQALARFEREVLITARLQHPGIVPVLEVGIDDHQHPYYAMCKVDGRTLASLIDDAPTIERRLALVPRVLAVCDAAAYAHARGVIHRDIKPWNILCGPFGETLLIDWGLARVLDDRDDDRPPDEPADTLGAPLTKLGQAFGTPGFMAPEQQVAGAVVDRRCDVYALGATLLHTLTGQRPTAVVGASQQTTQAGEPAPVAPVVAAIDSRCPPELVAIVTKAMAPLDERYRDAGALADELRRFTTGQLVAAHAYTVRALIARWVRRHRAWVTAAALAAVAIAVVGVLAIRAVIEQRDDAEAARAAAEEATTRANRAAEQQLIARAEAMVGSDPTYAAALSKTVDRSSPLVRDADAVIETARALGVARGRVVTPGIYRIAGSPDGHKFATLARPGEVVVHDSELAEAKRPLATITGALGIEWIDNGHVAVVTARDVTVFDLRGGVTTATLPEPATNVVGSRDGRLIVQFASDTGEVDPKSGEVTRLGSARYALRLSAATVLIVDNLVTYRADAGWIASYRARGEVGRIVMKPDGRGLLVVTSKEAVELAVDRKSLTEQMTWPLDWGRFAGVTEDSYYVLDQNAIWRLTRRLPRALTPLTSFSTNSTTSMVGYERCLYVVASHALWRMCGGSQPFTLMTGIDVTAASVVGHHLVAATQHGELMTWDLRSPERRRAGILDHVDAVIGDVALGGVSVIDLETTTKIAFGAPVTVRCLAADSALMSVASDGDGTESWLWRLDVTTKVATKFASRAALLTCSRTSHRVAWIADDHVVVHEHDRLADPPLLSVPARAAEVDWLSVSDRWLAFARGGVIERIELATRARSSLVFADPIRHLVVDDRGRVAVANERGVTVWTDAGTSFTSLVGAMSVRDTAVGLVAYAQNRLYTLDHNIAPLPFLDGNFDPTTAVMASKSPNGMTVEVTDLVHDTRRRFLARPAQVILGYGARELHLIEPGQTFTIDLTTPPVALDKLTNAVINPATKAIEWQ